MLSNYLKIAWRNIWKQRSAAIINIVGLALGLACFFLVIVFVRHERNYDTFHPDLDRLYRFNYHLAFDNPITHARVPPPLAPKAKEVFPEIDQIARVYPRAISARIPETNQASELEQVYFADADFTTMLGFDFITGDAKTALQEPFSVAISESLAIQLFGSIDAVDRELQLAGADQFRVRGVFKDWPDQAHLPMDMLIHYENMIDVEPEAAQQVMESILQNNWIASHSYTYVKLQPQADYLALNDGRFKEFILQYGMERLRDKQDFQLFPVADLHLNSPAAGEIKAPADADLLRIFLAIGIITLLIAVVNFVNLATASSLRRAKEVGMRKVLGAKRQALLGQFLGESILLSGIAFLLALLIASLSLPALSSMTGLELSLDLLGSNNHLLLFASIFVLTGLLAGLYPAVFMSNFQPLAVLQGRGGDRKPGGLSLRKVLITLQFVVAILFIGGAGVVYLQLDFLRSQPRGFAQDQMVALPLASQNNINAVFRPGDATLRQRMNTFDEELLQHPNIQAVTQSAGLPGTGSVSRNVWTDEVPQTDNFFAPVLAVDYDFAETYDLKVLVGREFDAEYGTDHLSGFVINEQAVADLGWAAVDDALEQRLVVEGKEGKVVGVVQDFHLNSLHSAISPLIMEVRPGAFGFFSVKVGDGDLPNTLAFMEETWDKTFPEKVFEYNFLDETLSAQYQAEEELSTLVSYFAFLAIFISCFGLFGLAALLTKQRFREIGIRKVLGARVNQITWLIAKDFMWLIGFALIAAVPLCWYFLNGWMTDFAYRIDFPWWVFAFVGLLVMLVAFFTVSSQTIRAAIANPVEAIRQD